MKKPDICKVKLVESLPPEYYPPGVAATEFDAGDFILVKGYPELRHKLIRLGQWIRIHGDDKKYVDWSHAAMVVDRSGTVIEAVGKGVKETSLDKYLDSDYALYRIKVSDEDRIQVANLARWTEQHHRPYGWLTLVSIGLTVLTGSKLAFFIDGEFVCSGLVASALERAGCIFTRSARHMAPADLAKYFDPTQPHQQADCESSSQASH